jgi:membrane protein YqaA with SNARE-associated domain
MKKFVVALTQYGPLGVFVLAILDSAGIPFPVAVDAAVVLIASRDRRSAVLVAISSVLGSAIGSMFLYYLGKKGEELYLEKHTLSPRSRRFRQWFQHYGLVSVFIPSLLPIPLPMKVFVLSAGVFGVRPLAFLLVVLAARILRYFGLAYLGHRLGEDGAVHFLTAHGTEALLIAVAVLGLCVLLIKTVDYRKARQPATR